MKLRSSLASRPRRRCGRLLALLGACAIATACGQKGPLTLPSAVTPAATPASNTASAAPAK